MLLYPTLLYFDCCFKLLSFEVIWYTAKLTDRVSKWFTHIQVNDIIPVHLRTWGILNSIIPISELNIYTPMFWTHMELHMFFFGTETFTFAHHLSLTPGMTWLPSLCSLDLKLIACPWQHPQYASDLPELPAPVLNQPNHPWLFAPIRHMIVLIGVLGGGERDSFQCQCHLVVLYFFWTSSSGILLLAGSFLNNSPSWSYLTLTSLTSLIQT